MRVPLVAKLLGFVLLAVAGIGLGSGTWSAGLAGTTQAESAGAAASGEQQTPETAKTAIATFAGGCFWCVESDFDRAPGVLETVSGYTGGTTENPTYKTHTAAKHREVVQITYDPSKVSYEALLDIFWRSVDPTDAGGQFCDRGHSYTTAVYANSPAQLALARLSRANLDKSGQLKEPVVTDVVVAGAFWPAERYHQDYYKKNPLRYKYYRFGCGRDRRIEAVWGDQAHKGLLAH